MLAYGYFCFYKTKRMKANRENFLTNNGRRILFILFGFIMIYLITYLIDPYAYYWTVYFKRSVQDIAIELVFTLFFCILISESSIYLNTKFNNFISWMERPVLRLVLQTLSTLVCTALIIGLEFAIGYLFDDQKCTFGQEEITGISQWVIVSSIIALMISGVNTASYLINNWKNSAIQAAEFKQAAAEAELHALKLQVDPHFVFNNLSVLSELILENQQLGYDYAENFSKVYRYLLLNAKKDIISLEDELKFVYAYIFLISKRVGTGVVFEIDIHHQYLSLQLPPLTMQILIENALKHNKTVKSKPLEISITVDEQQYLIVSNNLIPLERKPIASGIGLANIIDRYKLLSNEEVRIESDHGYYRVSIPLLKSLIYQN